MASDRYIPSGVEKALFLLSRGRCYYPTCPEPVLRLCEGVWIVNVEIAHIAGLKLGSKRHVKKMTKQERNDFRNLILLCVVHHKFIDKVADADKIDTVDIDKWKTMREADYAGKLTALEQAGDWLTQEKLMQGLVDVVTRSKQEILAAIDQLSMQSKTAADMLRSMVGELYDRPYANPDDVQTMAYVAKRLGEWHDSTPGIARRLEEWQDSVSATTQRLEVWEESVSRLPDKLEETGFTRVAYQVTGDEFGQRLASLTRVHNEVSRTAAIPTQRGRLEATVGEVAAMRAPTNRTLELERQRWTFLLVGLGLGVVLAVLVGLAI